KIYDIDVSAPTGSVDGDIRQLSAPKGKVKYLFWIDPGGPMFDYSPPMKRLIERGTAIQPRLLEELKNTRIRKEVALVLAAVGDKDALPHLIELLPALGIFNKDEDLATMCLLYALWQLTGKELGIDHKFGSAYTPEFRTQWQSWYESNKDYLYTPSKPRRSSDSWGVDRVLVDFEAKLAAKPTAVYRKEHPWIDYEEIKAWRDGPDYEQKLKDFCFSTILNPHGIRSLGHIRDPRALAALHSMCALTDGSIPTDRLIRTLEERSDP